MFFLLHFLPAASCMCHRDASHSAIKLRMVPHRVTVLARLNARLHGPPLNAVPICSAPRESGRDPPTTLSSLTAGRPYSVDLLIDLITASTPDQCRSSAIRIRGVPAGKAETSLGRSWAQGAMRTAPSNRRSLSQTICRPINVRWRLAASRARTNTIRYVQRAPGHLILPHRTVAWE